MPFHLILSPEPWICACSSVVKVDKNKVILRYKERRRVVRVHERRIAWEH
jgi:hypothetical protein